MLYNILPLALALDVIIQETVATPEVTGTEPPEQSPFYILVLNPANLATPELTPDQVFTLSIYKWAKSRNEAHAIQFVRGLANKRAIQAEVTRLMTSIEQLHPAAQTLAIELVAKGAFTRRELKEPERITGYFARPDWAEIIATWRGSRLREIGQVIQAIEAVRGRKSKEAAAPPPPVSTNIGRDNRDKLVNHLKTVLPSELRKWATDYAVAVRILAANPNTRMDAKALAIAVKQRRAGTGTKVSERTIGDGLPHLVKHGYVMIGRDMVQIRPGAPI